MSLKPLEDRVVVKPSEVDDTTPGGIIIPANAKEKSQRGEVIAVGPGKKTDTGTIIPTVKIGDKVLFSKYAGVEISSESVDLLIMHESDILAII